MKEIDCQTSHCEHNLKCKCMAGIISVGDNAKCLSRIKRDGGALAQSFADVEAGEEFRERRLDGHQMPLADILERVRTSLSAAKG